MMRRARGFTLVELLVVLTLSSVIMLALVAALRSMSQTELRVDQWLARLDERRVVQNFVPSILGRVSARRAEMSGLAGRPVVLFDGRPDSVSWVGVMPAREGAGGRYHFRLALEPGRLHATDAPQVLVVRYLPFRLGATVQDWAAAEARVLLRDALGLVLAYEDARRKPAEWVDHWTVTERLPDAVRIRISTARDDLPLLFVPLRVLPWGAGAGSGVATFGGGAEE